MTNYLKGLEIQNIMRLEKKPEANNPTFLHPKFKGVITVISGGAKGLESAVNWLSPTNLWLQKSMLLPYETTFSASAKSILETADKSFIFQEDNPSSYRAACINKKYLSLGGVLVLPLPAQNADINIIENV